MLASIDINCDMGESFGNWQMGNDAGMMPLITTANVACGFHAGDPVTLLNTCKLAGQHGVVVGSHPGLPDLLGFGRRAMNITPEDAYAYVVYQTGALQAALRANGMKLHHIKPHGAFYSVLRTNEALDRNDVGARDLSTHLLDRRQCVGDLEAVGQPPGILAGEAHVVLDEVEVGDVEGEEAVRLAAFGELVALDFDERVEGGGGLGEQEQRGGERG